MNINSIVNIVPPSVFEFTGDIASGQASGKLQITNITNDKLYYKLKTTKPDRYCVLPSSGILNGQESIVLEVRIKDKDGTKESLKDDRFLLQILLFHHGKGHEGDPDAAFLNADKAHIMKTKLQVSYLSQGVQSHNSQGSKLGIDSFQSIEVDPTTSTPQVQLHKFDLKASNGLPPPPAPPVHSNTKTNELTMSSIAMPQNILANHNDYLSPPNGSPNKLSAPNDLNVDVQLITEEDKASKNKPSILQGGSNNPNRRYNFSTVAVAGSIYNPNTLIRGNESLYFVPGDRQTLVLGPSDYPPTQQQQHQQQQNLEHEIGSRQSVPHLWPSNFSQGLNGGSQQHSMIAQSPASFIHPGFHTSDSQNVITQTHRNSNPSPIPLPSPSMDSFSKCHIWLFWLFFLLGLLLGYVFRYRIDILVGCRSANSGGCN